MSDDPRERHVHEESCWETVSICAASDLPQHEHDHTCWQVNLICGFRALY